jgi:arylsulfatase
VHEGGISTPLIVNWPRGISAHGELRHTPSHLIDLLPTILELAGGARPNTLEGIPIVAAPGKSLFPAFAQDGPVKHDSLWWLHEGNRALLAGDWKIVSTRENGAWELYNLKEDRAESKNLAAAMPEKVSELSELWRVQTKKNFTLAEASKSPAPRQPSNQLRTNASSKKTLPASH